MSQSPTTIRYNLKFVQRIFSTRAKTEALLGPERESGLLTAHDYDAAVDFLPGFHRHYQDVGLVLGGCLSYAAKRPGWSKFKTTGLFVLGLGLGKITGEALSFWSHIKFLKSIEDRPQFFAALERVEKKLAQKTGTIGQQWEDSAPELADDSSSAAPPHAAEHREVQISPSPPQQQTSWDRVRIANAKGAKQSSWDTIRQGHERAEMQRRPPQNQTPDGSGRYISDDDRAQEQANFDAMLEKERNFRSNN